ncbi:hypothetical protein EK904_008956 [Melospiza melodia maxima]|nr:hypothetical protein EK904_008956 [Melospiza melodia maxima]
MEALVVLSSPAHKVFKFTMCNLPCFCNKTPSSTSVILAEHNPRQPNPRACQKEGKIRGVFLSTKQPESDPQMCPDADIPIHFPWNFIKKMCATVLKIFPILAILAGHTSGVVVTVPEKTVNVTTALLLVQICLPALPW